LTPILVMSANKGKVKDRIRNIAEEAITLQGPMTGRQIADYAIDNHKGVRWIPHTAAISGILASDKKGRFVADKTKKSEWRLRA